MIVTWGVWDPSTGAALGGAIAALTGPLVEMLVVAVGADEHAFDADQLAAVAAWLPCLYFPAGAVACWFWDALRPEQSIASPAVAWSLRSPMPAGPCLFCGKGRAVRSRVMPAWMDLCFPDDRPLNAKRALACKECTEGWIKELEHRSRPLVGGMIAGLPVILAQQNQEMLARWVAKTVLSLQADRDPELLPLGVYHQLTETGRPPDGLRVSVALRPREGKWPYRFASMGSASTLRDWDVEPTFPGTLLDHYYAELCLGHLVIRVGAQWTPHGHKLPVGPAAIEVWPMSTPVRWPPKRGIVRLLDERIPEGPIADQPDVDEPIAA